MKSHYPDFAMNIFSWSGTDASSNFPKIKQRKGSGESNKMVKNHSKVHCKNHFTCEFVYM